MEVKKESNKDSSFKLTSQQMAVLHNVVLYSLSDVTYQELITLNTVSNNMSYILKELYELTVVLHK